MLERADEMDRLKQAVASASRGQGRLLVVQAAAGLGKTRLLAEGCETADPSTLLLIARGTALERDYPFGVVRQLFERHLEAVGAATRRSLLSGAAGLAAPVFDHAGPLGLPRPRPEAISGTLHGLYWLCSNLAESHPLLLCVDDAHWSDPASLRFLAYLAPRLADLPVTVLIAVHPGDSDDLLSQVIADPAAEHLTLRALSRQVVGNLVGAAFDTPPADHFVRACHQATGGNPFLLKELLSELVEAGVRPEAQAAPQVERTTPATVSLAIQARLSRLRTADQRLARAVAVLGGEAELRRAADLAKTPVRTAAPSADRLAAVGILTPGRPLRFTHPIVGAAVYAALPAAERDAGHLRAARLLQTNGAPEAQVCLQLFGVEPAGRDWVAEQFLSVAAQAIDRGAPRAAARYLRRALAEPPPPGARAEALAALGSVEAILGSPDALQHLRAALAAAETPDARVPIAIECATALAAAGRGADAVELLDTAIDALEDPDADLGWELEAQRSLLATIIGPGARPAPRRRPRLRDLRQPPGQMPTQAPLLAEAAFAACVSGVPVARVVELAERALPATSRLWRDHGLAAAAAVQHGQVVYVLLASDRFTRAEQVLQRERDLAGRRGAAMPLALALGWSSHLAVRRGDLSKAVDDAERAVQLIRLHRWRGLLPQALAFLVDALVECGRLEEAGRLLDDDGFVGPLPDGMGYGFLLDSRAALRQAQGATADALEDLRELAAREDGRRAANPGMCAWRSRTALLLAAEGEQGEALRLVSDEVDLARSIGAARSVGIALRAAGVVRGYEVGLGNLEESASLLAGSPARLEYARTLADLGWALRRHGNRRRDAVRAWQRALALATDCGAGALSERVRSELLVLGSRPRRFPSGGEALTPSEQRIATMASEGLANRDIAQALFVSLKTVEMHLTHTYAKLGIRSRSQLVSALSTASSSQGLGRSATDRSSLPAQARRVLEPQRRT